MGSAAQYTKVKGGRAAHEVEAKIGKLGADIFGEVMRIPGLEFTGQRFQLGEERPPELSTSTNMSDVMINIATENLSSETYQGSADL